MKPSYIDTFENRQPEAGIRASVNRNKACSRLFCWMRLSMFRALLYRLD
jgi:hypothetical protein